MTKTRVNLLTAVNAASVEIDRLSLDDEPYIAIRNVMWMTDDIVMNDGLYPKSENEKGYASMDGRIMPFGHPQVAGEYVVISNLDNKAAATALAKYYGGVHAENVRKSGDGYYADVMINERVARAHKDGGLLLEWVGNAEKYKAEGGQKPGNIHMSTGLLLERKQQQGNSKGKSYSWVATNQSYDHLAILFHEQGAGGDKVSIAVNCDLVINSELPLMQTNEDALKDSYGEKRDLLNAAVKERYATGDNYAYVEDFDNEAAVVCLPDRMFKVRYSMEDGNPILGEEVGDVVSKTEYELKRPGMLANILERFKDAVQWNSKQTTKPVQANETEEEDMSPEEVQAIVDKAIGAVNQSLESVQAENATLKAQVAATEAALAANAESGLASKRAIVAEKLGEVIANSLSGDALEDAVARCSVAAPLVGGFQGNQEEADELAGYSINSHAEAK
jgi:hypothetical protein